MGLPIRSDESSRGGTILFTVFVLLQFWNLFNARMLGTNESAFTGLLENRSFLLIAIAILVGQILLVQFGSSVFRTQALVWWEWLIILAATSLVLVAGELIRRMQQKSATPRQQAAPQAV